MADSVWWYGGEDVDAPVQTTGPGHPGRDAEGRTMWVNTHFATEAQAWGKIVGNARARQSLASTFYRDAEARLAACTKDLAHEAARRTDIERAFEEWRRAPSPEGAPKP